MLNFGMPECINFGWAEFLIIPEDGPIINSEGEELHGEVCFDAYVIRVNIKQSVDAIQETLLHEITHVILEQSGMGAEMVSEMDNETKTLVISRNIVSLLRLNTETLLELFKHGTAPIKFEEGIQ
tara:strand:+ start:1322 stop:1696 length:375 start_codon:yes stop_codon:yes gene_type:complete